MKKLAVAISVLFAAQATFADISVFQKAHGDLNRQFNAVNIHAKKPIQKPAKKLTFFRAAGGIGAGILPSAVVGAVAGSFSRGNDPGAGLVSLAGGALGGVIGAGIQTSLYSKGPAVSVGTPAAAGFLLAGSYEFFEIIRLKRWASYPTTYILKTSAPLVLGTTAVFATGAAVSRLVQGWSGK